MPTDESLAALAWLVDAGADEAVGDAPVNRFQSRATQVVRPALEGGSKFAAHSRANFEEESNPLASRKPEVPLGGAMRPATITPTAVLNPLASDNDHVGQAIEIAKACTTLPELKAALETFEGCDLKKLAANTVFADGNPEARILFIGEAPGYEEDRSGLPFVGRAGKLLDKMLAAIGLDRTSAYIINVLPWRPPDNRNPDATEVAKCIPFMRRHIELHAPEVMVLLGGVAVRHVLGKTEGIMQTRGKWQQYHVAGRMVPVMPTLHPAYLLRQPAHKQLAWRDLLALLDKIEKNHRLAR